MADASIVTRFAPSPTGALHVGGARTALFNWAYARRHGGRFILRIEDTDRARSTDEATRGILRDLAWLGLDWDDGPDPDADDPYAIDTQRGDVGPYFQSQRQHEGIYQPFVDRLLADDRAYDDDGAVRFKMPGTDITVHDEILGDVTVAAADLEDFIIVKSDGYPTFHFAVVVDDAAMGVTHVIRGQEHLNNTPRHAALQDALGFDRPVFAHIPLIFNADGSKMSKRDKAKAARAAALDACTNDESKDALVAQVAARRRDMPEMYYETNLLGGTITEDQFDETDVQGFLDMKHNRASVAAYIADVLDVTLPEIDVSDFRISGYLPEALVNYIALLGWSPGDNVEQFGDAPSTYMRQRFDLASVNTANARFDRDKLRHFNADALSSLQPNEFQKRLFNHGNLYLNWVERSDDKRFVAFARAYHQRSHTLHEPQQIGKFFFCLSDDIEYDTKAVTKVLHKKDGEGLAVLRALRAELDAIDDWTAEPIEAFIKGFAESRELGMGKVAQPLRVAVSGNTVSPSIGDTLAILGKGDTLKRIDRCLLECQMPST